MIALAISMAMIFQSTLPVGGATRGGEDYRHLAEISIHAPRGGSDLMIM